MRNPRKLPTRPRPKDGPNDIVRSIWDRFKVRITYHRYEQLAEQSMAAYDMSSSDDRLLQQHED